MLPLAEDTLKPWRCSWIFRRDPAFAAKAGAVLDLDDRSFQAERLGQGQYVISADEKTSITRTAQEMVAAPS